MATNERVVVVGAGLAGLSAARRLAHAEVEVVVLEARDRVGGRVVNHVFDDGVVVELGGQWVGPTQDHVLALIDELGLATFESFDEGEGTLLMDGVVKRFRGETFGLPPHVVVEAGLVQKRLERMARQVPLDAPWNADRAKRWDGETVESWLRRNVRQERVRTFWRAVVAAIFSTEASDLSLLHFLFYCKSGGMLDRLMNTRDGAQDRRVVGGTQRIAELIAAELGAAVRLASPVVGIDQNDHGVVVRTASDRFDAGAVVVAVPPHLVGRIDFQPPLPGRRAQLVQKMPMGAVIKCIVRYAEPFWRRAGLSGFSVALGHPVSLTFDNSPPDGRCGLMLAFIEGVHARTASGSSVGERRRMVADAVAERFGQADVIDYVDLDWTTEVHTGGCYGAHLAPGVWTQLGPALRPPHGRVHWAGTESATVWNGYMDGAIASGSRVADDILRSLEQEAG